MDWSYAYRLFTEKRLDPVQFFAEVRRAVLQELPCDDMIIAHMDDTLLRKTGKKTHGTAWRRDPLGPAFHTNFIWGQRFLQLSMALPEKSGICRSRAIPVDFRHCPTAKKPNKTAGEQAWMNYMVEKQKLNLSRQGSERIHLLRNHLDGEGAAARKLLISVDGSYTNQNVLKTLPERVSLIGRIRKDAKLYEFAGQQSGVGRKRVYGERLPTPEKIRQSDSYPWQQVEAWAAGKSHLFNVKVLRDVRWRTAGGGHDLQLVIIRPLAYRLTKQSNLLYRDPTYLICTDPTLSIQKLLQAYLWRWEIEVNFRDEKTLLGCGEAQVRTSTSVERVPAFQVSIYAMLQIAAHRAFKNGHQLPLPKPKWDPPKDNQRISTNEILNLFRTQLWAQGLGTNFSGFVSRQYETRTLKNTADPLISALCYRRE